MDNPDKTSLNNNNKDIKTGIYSNKNNDESKTGIYSEKKENESFSSQGISIGDKLQFKDKEYIVNQFISQGTGEGNVYQIEDTSGNLFALKVYFEFNDEAEEPNGIALERIHKLNDADILRLIDFGIGQEKYLGKYCYEIADFALGGNILEVKDFKKKYTPEFIETEIIPQIYLAITKLHEYKIYHCDIKPGNIFYKDKEQTDIIIGDYGSAKAYDLKSEKALRKSTTIKGTEFYLAPEQARGIVSEKNDYYSFGMVLLHLLYPESFSSGPDFRRIEGDKFEQIIERQYNLKPIIEFNPKWKRLNTLIEGLTLINHLNRWGSAEIEKWLKGEKIEVSYRTKGTADVKPLKTGPIEIYNAEEFINYLETKPTWFGDFFEDTDVYRMVKDWLDSYIGIPDRKRFEKHVDLYKLSGKAVLQTVLKLFLLPKNQLYIEGMAFDFNNEEELVSTVNAYIMRIDSIYRISTMEQLLIYFIQLEYRLKAIYYENKENKTVYALLSKLFNPFNSDIRLDDNFNFKLRIPEHIKPAKGDFNFEYLITIFHAFNKNRAYPDNNGKSIENLEDLALFYLKNKNLFTDKYHIFERNVMLAKFKSNKLADKNLMELASHALSKHSEIVLNIYHISFDKICNVHYSIKYIIDSYLKQNGVNETYTIKEDMGYIYADKNRLSASSAANAFIKYLNDEHGDIQSWSKSLDPLKTEFKKHHRKYYLFNRIVSITTTLFIIAVIAAILLRIFELLKQH